MPVTTVSADQITWINGRMDIEAAILTDLFRIRLTREWREFTPSSCPILLLFPYRSVC